MAYKFNIFTGTFDIVSAVTAAVLARLAQNNDYRTDQAGNYRIDQSQ